MLGISETVRRNSPLSNQAAQRARLVHHMDDDLRLKKSKARKSQYEKRKTAGLCSYGGCHANAEPDSTRCRRHLREMSRNSKERYRERVREGICVYCGERPSFWGVRCVICRQRFAKHPLPFGARRALRLYREAEKQRQTELIQVEVRMYVRKLMASGDLNGKHAEAARLYAGVDDGRWRTLSEVGEVMNISKERVRQLLRPSKLGLGQILGDRSL